MCFSLQIVESDDIMQGTQSSLLFTKGENYAKIDSGIQAGAKIKEE